MNELNVLKSILMGLEDQLPQMSEFERIETAAALWQATEKIGVLMENIKADMRQNGKEKIMARKGHFRVSKPQTLWRLRKDLSLSEIDRIRSALGRYFDMLFQRSYKTKPKFEEVFDALSESQKFLLLESLEQHTLKSRISFIAPT